MLDYLHLEAATNLQRPPKKDEDDKQWKIRPQSIQVLFKNVLSFIFVSKLYLNTNLQVDKIELNSYRAAKEDFKKKKISCLGFCSKKFILRKKVGRT